MDVARRAGVSKVTVSYVLNGHGEAARISSATTEKVLTAARELGYSPSAIARMMVTKSGSTLGVVFQYAQYFTVWSSFTNEVMHGICQATVANGYDLMLHTGSLSNGRSEADALADGRVDGVLILRNQDDETLVELLRRPLPLVLFFARSEQPGVAFVDADNFDGGRIATRHLIELGHRRIGALVGNAASTSSNDRYRGYLAEMKHHGVAVEEDTTIRVLDYTATDRRLHDLLNSPKRPTAFACWSDDAALYLLRIAGSLGIRIPADLSIVGFDSLAPAGTSNPPLTSISQPVREIAKAATEQLIKMCRHEPVEMNQIVFPVKLDVRGSTGPPTLA